MRCQAKPPGSNDGGFAILFRNKCSIIVRANIQISVLPKLRAANPKTLYNRSHSSFGERCHRGHSH